MSLSSGSSTISFCLSPVSNRTTESFVARRQVIGVVWSQEVS